MLNIQSLETVTNSSESKRTNEIEREKIVGDRSNCFSSSVNDSFNQSIENEEDNRSDHRWNSGREFMSEIDSSLSDEEVVSECLICLEELSIEVLSCCSSSICVGCLSNYLSVHINEGRVRVTCPSCPHIYTHEQILRFLSFNNEDRSLIDRYQSVYADMNNQSHRKTCPHCCAMKEIDRKLCVGIGWKRNLPRKVLCDQCQLVWCFHCHCPWHEKISCKEYQKGEQMLQSWAQQIEQNQPNAQKCPRCKVYISRNGGCTQMICLKCQCHFCYNCGKRRFAVKLFGSHESRISPLGCKYNFYPDKPIVRHTIRGLVVGGATLALPVAAVGAVAFLAIGTTIGVPTYGTYRLIKHIRSKREHQQRRIYEEDISQSSSTTTTNSLSTYLNDDEDQLFERVIQTSLITSREQTPNSIRHRNNSNPKDHYKETFF